MRKTCLAKEEKNGQSWPYCQEQSGPMLDVVERNRHSPLTTSPVSLVPSCSAFLQLESIMRLSGTHVCAGQGDECDADDVRLRIAAPFDSNAVVC